MPKGRKLNESPTRMHLKIGRMSTDTTALSTASNNADVQANEETGLSDTSLNLRTPNFFDKIPPELRVLIYEFAYCKAEPLKVRLARPTDPHNQHVLNPVMVSKQWYYEAMNIFMRSREFYFSTCPMMLAMLEKLSDPAAACITSVLLHAPHEARTDAIRALEPGWLQPSNLTPPDLQKKLTKLMSLRLHFYKLPDLTARPKTSRAEAFLTRHGLSGLCNLRGLKRFDIVVEEHKKFLIDTEDFCWGPIDGTSYDQWFYEWTASLWLLQGDSIVEDIKSQVTLPEGI